MSKRQKESSTTKLFLGPLRQASGQKFKQMLLYLELQTANHSSQFDILPDVLNQAVTKKKWQNTYSQWFFSGFNIYQVEEDSEKRLGQDFCVQNDGEKGLGTKNLINIGEIMITLEMKPGFNYVIIPFTYKPDQEGNFLLRFVSENHLTLNELWFWQK